jgi:hypothetical protein
MAIIRTAGIAVAARATSQAEMAPSTASASTACKFRRIVDSLGANRPSPSRTRIPTGRSWAHSAIAVNVRAPASTAQTPTARIATNPCRTPRRGRGSGTAASAPSRSAEAVTTSIGDDPNWSTTLRIGEDEQADTAIAPVIV